MLRRNDDASLDFSGNSALQTDIADYRGSGFSKTWEKFRQPFAAELE
jgi:hypothetical protein